jgi:hypothetical protein
MTWNKKCFGFPVATVSIEAWRLLNFFFVFSNPIGKDLELENLLGISGGVQQWGYP